MVTVALRAPPAAGENVTLIVHDAPAATVLGASGQLLVCAKSAAFVPLTPIAVTDSAALPVLVTVAVAAALVVPTAWLGKLRLAGESETAGTGVVVPVPDSGTACGLPAASSVIDSDAV